ncbi:MAG: hypothetical protein ACOYMA_08660 [Bacteroidia bacterium]
MTFSIKNNKGFKLLIFLILLSNSFLLTSLHAQSPMFTMTMQAYPPQRPLDWLNAPSPITITVMNPTLTSSLPLKFLVTVTKGGQNAITSNLVGVTEIRAGRGATIINLRDIWDENSFTVNNSLVDITSGKLLPASPFSRPASNYEICVEMYEFKFLKYQKIGSSICRTFNISEQGEPIANIPNSNREFTPTTITPINFSWSPVSNYLGIVKYQLEVFEIDEISSTAVQVISKVNILPVEVSNIPSYTWTDAAAKFNSRKTNGVTSYKYAWRVKAVDGEGNPIGKNEGLNKGYSNIQEFYIVDNPNVAGNVATTNSGSNTPKKVIEPEPTNFIDNDKISANNVINNGIEFKWSHLKNYTGEVNYKLMIFQKGNPIRIFEKDSIKENSYLFKVPANNSFGEQEKEYTWVIFASDRLKQALGSKQQKTPQQIKMNHEGKGFSEKGKFTITPLTQKEAEITLPINNGTATYNNEKKGIEFTWEQVSPKKVNQSVSYKFDVYKSKNKKKDGNSIFSTTIKDTSFVLWNKQDLAEGDYVCEITSAVTPVPNNSTTQLIGIKTGSSKGISNLSFFTYSKTEKVDSVEYINCDGTKKYITNKGANQSGSVTDFKNKFIKVNEFSMLIKQASGSASSLKGTGSIVVPWLKTPITVEFEGLNINVTTMKLTSGAIYAKTDENGSDIPKFLKVKEGKKITKNLANELNKKLKTNSNSKLVANQDLDQNTSKINTSESPSLPLGINNLLGYTIAITEMQFTAFKNILVGVAILPYSKDQKDDIISFAATDIEFGLNSPSKAGGKLVLLEDFAVVDSGESSYGVYFKAENEKKDPATYIEWDCKGFNNLKTTVDVILPKKWAKAIKEEGDISTEERVTARAEANIKNLNDWLLTLSIKPCEIQGLDGVELAVDNLTLDYSDTKNIPGMKFPSNYTGIKGVDFKGFYLQSGKFTLPKFYNKSTDTTGIEIEMKEFIINKQGITGQLSLGSEEAPIINLESGKIGDFQASLDKIEIAIVSNSLTKASIDGKMVLPISKSTTQEPNTLNYNASWSSQTAKTGAKMNINITVADNVRIKTSLLDGAELVLNNTSTISLTYTKGKTKKAKGNNTATVNLNGSLLIEKTIKDIPLSFDMAFTQIGFDYNDSLKKKFTFLKPTFSFASPQKTANGFPVTFEKVELVEEDPAPNSKYLATASVKFDVILNLNSKIGGSTNIIIQGGIKKEGSKYIPEFINASIGAISVDANLTAVKLKGSVALYSNDAVYGNGFMGNVDATFTKVSTQVQASLRFGSAKKENSTEEYTYWFAQAKIMLAKAIPLSGPIGLKGGGLAAWYNMRMSDTSRLDAVTVANTKTDVEETLSGSKFVPDSRVSFGFNIMAILVNNASDRVFNGDASISAQFTDAEGISFLRFTGSTFVGSPIVEREKAPIKGFMVVNYDFVKELFDLNVKVDIRNPVAGPALFQTREPATLNLFVDSKNKTPQGEPKWQLTVGTPEVPNKFKLYEIINTWSYFRAGNNLVTNNNFQPNTVTELTKIDASFAALAKPEPISENAIGGKGFDFGLGFNVSDNVSFGPFKGGYSVGAEINLAMAQYDATECVSSDFNYWYARGGIAAWASANVSFKSLLNAELKAAAAMKAGGPKPLWATGRVAGQIVVKILFIKFNFRANVPFTYGTICKPVNSANSKENMNNIGDLDMNGFLEAQDEYAMYKGTDRVDRLTPLQLGSYFDLSKNFNIEVTENDVVVTKTYKVDLKYFVGNGTNFTRYTHIMQVGADDIYYIGTQWVNGQARSQFPYNTYIVYYFVGTLQEKVNNEWVNVLDKNANTILKRTPNKSFTTNKN